MTYDQFKQRYLIENLLDKSGSPKHTRHVKHLFYKFAVELKQEFGFDMHKCDQCGLTEWNGHGIVLELEHKNRITNDSRITNLRMLCPNCHSQTDGYKNRKTHINEHHAKIKQLSEKR